MPEKKGNKKFVQVDAGQVVKADPKSVGVAVDMLTVKAPKGVTTDTTLLAKLWSSAT